MSTPQGWYDDGSGRQRWWDGTQWTDRFADQPASAAPDQPVRIGAGQTTPVDAGQATYPGAAVPAPAVAGQPAYAAAVPGSVATKKRVGVLAWIALGVTIVGAILSWVPWVIVPWVMGLGWFLLFVGLVLSIVSLFLKGAKWPGIVGIVLAVLASIVSGVVLLTTLLGYAAQHPDEFGNTNPTPAASAPAADASTPPATAAERPSAQQVADGFLTIVAASGAADQYTPETALCVAQRLVDSDVSTDSLINIANGKDIQSDLAEGQLVAQVTAEAVATCVPAQ